MFGKGAFAARQGHGPFAGMSGGGCDGGGHMGGPFGKIFGAKMGGGPGLLLSELNLSEEQLFRIAEVKGRTLAKVAHHKIELMEVKKEAFKELLQAQPDKAKIKESVEKIKARKAEGIDDLADSMIAFSEILTADQKSKLRLSLVKKFLGVEDFIEDDE